MRIAKKRMSLLCDTKLKLNNNILEATSTKNY